MRISVNPTELRTPLIGAAAAAVAGILLGGAMHPNLTEDFVAPQTLIPGGGPRDVAYAADAGTARYNGRVPDYVVGTDWVRPQAAAPEVQEVALPAADRVTDDSADRADLMAYTAHEDAPPRMVRASLEPTEPPVADYPSSRGGRYYESNLPAAPSPPGDDAAPANTN